MSPWENDPVATVANPWDNDPVAPWESDPVDEEQGYLSQLGDALGAGYQQMVAGTRASFNAATGDNADLSKNLAELGRLQREQDKAASPEDRAFQARMGVADKKWEAGDYIDSITDLFGAAIAEPGAAFKTAVQSAPNALVSIGTSVAGRGLGALAGGAAGIETGPGALLTGLGGALAGGAVANTLMESGPAIFDELNKRTGGLGAQLNDEQIRVILEGDPGILTEGLKKGVTRGVTIGLIESLGLYGAGKVAAVPERAAAAAARSALAREGVNVASREAVEAALRDPTLKALANKAGAETAKEFSKLGNVARWGGASAIETGAAGAGEAGAQLLTEGRVTPSGVAMEMIGDAVMSPAGTALSKGAELAGMGLDALGSAEAVPPAGAVPPVDDAPDVEAEQRAAEAEAMAGVRAAAEAARANPTVQVAAEAMATAEEAAPVAPATADAVADLAQQTIEQELSTEQTYAPQTQPIQEGVPSQRESGDQSRQAAEAGGSDSLLGATPSTQEGQVAGLTNETPLPQDSIIPGEPAVPVGESATVPRAGGVPQPGAFSDYLRTVTPTDRWTDTDYAAAQQFANGDETAIAGYPLWKRTRIVQEYLKFNKEAGAAQDAADKILEGRIAKQEKKDAEFASRTTFKKGVPEGIEDLPDDIASASIGGRGVPKYADTAFEAAVSSGDIEAARQLLINTARSFGVPTPEEVDVRDADGKLVPLSQRFGVRESRGAPQTFSLTKEDAQEVYHKLSVLAIEPDMQADYDVTQEQADALLASVPKEGGEWTVPDFATAAAAAELRDHVEVLRDQANDQRDSGEKGLALQIDKRAARIEKIASVLENVSESRSTEPTSPQSIEDYQAILTRKLGLTNFQNIVLSNYGTLPNGVRLKGFVRAGSNKVFLNLNSINNEEELVDTFLEEASHLIYEDPTVAAEWARLKELVPQDQLDALRAEMEARGYAESVWDEEAYNDIARKLGYEWLKQPVWRKAWEAIRSAVRRIFGLTDDKEINRVSAAIVAYAIEHQQSITDDVVAEGESRSSPFRASMEDEYMAAANAGDLATAQRLVDEAAKAAGYEVDSFHGTNGDLFTVFNPEMGGDKTAAQSAQMGIFSTNNADVAQSYADNIGMGGAFGMALGIGPMSKARDDALATDEGKRLMTQLEEAKAELPKAVEKAKAQLEIEAREKLAPLKKTHAEYFDSMVDTYVRSEFVGRELMNKDPGILSAFAQQSLAEVALSHHIEPYLINSLPNRRVLKLKLRLMNPKFYDAKHQTPGDFSLSDKIEAAKDEGYDSVVFENIIDPVESATHYVVFNPNQIKSAEPIVRDDSGRIIPLRERFNPESPDIRYSLGPSTDAIFADLDAEAPNSFEAYDAAKRSRLGEPPRGSANAFSAPRYTADQFDALFEKWFAANDYPSFLAAIKASDATTYRPTMKKLMRAAKGGDADAAARVEWFRHVISGTMPAGAAATQPEATAATPTAQPATPPPPVKPPPPIPRASSKPRVTLNTVAMTWLARKLGTSPTVNRFLRRARGRFVVRPDGTRVEVNEQLFKDPEQAAKTLAHEIGHFLDHLPAHILGANLVKRLAPLGDYKTVFGPLWDWAGGINNLNKVIKMEAIALSKDWRGDFDAKDKYRNSSSELYADFVSAFLNDPQWTAQKAPNITLAFLEALDQKPAVSAAYFNLVNLVKGGALYRAVAQDRTAAQAAAVRDVLNRTNHTADKRAKWQRSFWELYTAVANRYTATAAKAGGYWANRKHRIENFGRDYVTKQEQAGMFASRAVADLDNRMVNLVSQPLLTHFGKEGAGLLDRYLLNKRIIKERTATGEYLEQNPDEARQFLKWLVDKGSLGAAVAAEVGAAADADLYNLGARIIRQLHESQKFDDVYSEAQRVGAPPLAERGLFAFDVSGFMANPDGRTPESAAEDNQQIADTLGTGFADLEGIAQDYYGIMRGYAEEANSLGLFKPEVWNERIAPNLDSYVPFMVLDYFNGHTDAAIRSRVGTFKGTMPSQMAGWLKAKALIGRMQRQKQVLLLKGFFEKEGKQFGFADEMTPITDRNMDRAKADRMEREQDVAVLGYWDEGTFKWLKFDDKTAAESIQSFNPDDLNAMLGLLRTNANVWRTLVTVLSPAFIIRNAMRGVRTSWTRLGVKNAATAVKLILKSIPAGMRYGRYKLAELLAPRLAKAMKERDFKFIMDSTIVAQYALYTTEGVRPSPELQDLLDKGILTSAFMKDTGGMTQDEVQEGILAGLIAPDAMLRPSRQQQNWFDKTLRPNLGAIWAFMQNIAAIQEAAPKVSAYETLRGRTDMTEEMKQAIARMEGIPNPGVGGKMNKYLEFIFLFWRVALQGHRATLNSAMNPKTRGGFFLRFLASELAPKALYALAAAGVLDAIMGGDDEDEQVDMAEAVKRLSPYKIQKDDALPLFWLKPDGGIEWMYGHKSIPENWTPIAIRIPASEEGRWASPASAFLMDKLFAPDMAPVDTNKFAGELLGGMLPGFNPTFERLGQYKAALFDPEPPRDAYRNRPIMPEDKWVDGSIPERMWGISKDVLTQAGLPLSTSNYRNENLPAGLTGLLSLPVLRTVVASDNYYGVLDEQRRRYDEKLASAAARNMRGEVTRDMVRRYESLKSKGEDNRTDIEAAEYDALRQWHNRDYEGSERRPGLMQDLREAAKAKQGKDEMAKAVLIGQAKDSAAALEASAQDLRELLRELRRESQ